MSDQRERSYDIGSILSEMRQEYWLGLAAEETETDELLECLVFTLGGESFAFETHFAAEVIRVPKLIRVPAVQPVISGVFNLRGEITAAMDIRPMLGLSRPELTETARVVVVRSERFATGILVEKALGVIGLPLEQFEPAPAAKGGERGLIRGQIGHEGGEIALLDIALLLASPEIVAGDE